MTTHTVNEGQEIDQVAGIIHDNLLVGWEDDPLAKAREINADGWTFEVRYRPVSNNYVSQTDCTRVQGLCLSDADLMIAYRLAESWME